MNRKICLNCGKKFIKTPNISMNTWKTLSKFCSYKCYWKYMQGENHPRWKNGRRINKEGYVIILRKNHPFTTRDNYMMEHRIIMEKQLKRYLKPKEVVHHINGNKQDNRISNLLLMNKKDHPKIHPRLFYHRDHLGRFI